MAVKTQPKSKPVLKKVEKILPVGRSVRVESGDVYIVQRNIPISGTYRSLGPTLRYPFHEMETGESFEIKTNPVEARKIVSRVSSACTSYVKRANKAAKFTVRRTSDQTVRVWRVK